MKKYSLALLAGSALFPTSVLASGSNHFDYFGVSWLQSHYEGVNFTPVGKSFDRAELFYDDEQSSQGYRVFVGHQVNAYVGFEGSYAKHGRAKFSVVEQTLVVDEAGDTAEFNEVVLARGSHETKAFELRAFATYPLSEKTFVRAHIGVMAWQRQYDQLLNTKTLLVDDVEESDYSMNAGVGFGYGINRNWALFFDIEQTEFADVEANSFSISISYKL